jgi:hypothetical protein
MGLAISRFCTETANNSRGPFRLMRKVDRTTVTISYRSSEYLRDMKMSQWLHFNLPDNDKGLTTPTVLISIGLSNSTPAGYRSDVTILLHPFRVLKESIERILFRG